MEDNFVIGRGREERLEKAKASTRKRIEILLEIQYLFKVPSRNHYLQIQKGNRMSETEKRKAIKKYFDGFPIWPIFLIIIGFFQMIKSSDSGFYTFGGILIMLVGVLLISLAIHKKPSDNQIDQWLEEDLQNLNQIALTKLGTSKSDCIESPVDIRCPRLWDIGGSKVEFKKGEDGNIRYSPIGVTIFNFTRDQILVYSCIWDFLTGNQLNEKTDEFFYQDVVSVSTKTESKIIQVNKIQNLKLNSAETFSLTTSAGSSVSVILKDPALIKRLGGGNIPMDRVERAIHTIRKVLREKKALPA